MADLSQDVRRYLTTTLSNVFGDVLPETGTADSGITVTDDSQGRNNTFIKIIIYNKRVLSNDGYCKPYDEEGSDYMRSDAAVVVCLQKAKDARRIYAIFVYGKTNCDGFKSEGITFPSLDKQKMILKEFYEECDISPIELSYIEAHATGTLAGDSVELQAIDEVLCAKRQLPLLLGSVKSNIGHPEAVSGQIALSNCKSEFTTKLI